MALPQGELTCKDCGHSFNRLVNQKEKDSRCPRCGGQDLEEVPYLLGTADPDVSAEDYFDVALAPCCTANWMGWRHHFYSTGAWASTQSGKPKKSEAEEDEKAKEGTR
jgi:predicted  nucleic acid-binding Zn-ribbon protein